MDIALFRTGLLQYAKKENLPNASMDRIHYLQHHLMERRYSKKACVRMLHREHRLMTSRGAIPRAPSVERMASAPNQGDDSADEDEDSEDEVVLPHDEHNDADLGW